MRPRPDRIRCDEGIVPAQGALLVVEDRGGVAGLERDLTAGVFDAGLDIVRSVIHRLHLFQNVGFVV